LLLRRKRTRESRHTRRELMRLKKMMENLILKLLKLELKLLQMKKPKKEAYLEKVERSRCRTSTTPHQMKNMI
jgi:hypothetical protein